MHVSSIRSHCFTATLLHESLSSKHRICTKDLLLPLQSVHPISITQTNRYTINEALPRFFLDMKKSTFFMKNHVIKIGHSSEESATIMEEHYKKHQGSVSHGEARCNIYTR